MHQGQSSLPADEMGRVLDRLAGLEQVIRPEAVRQARAATGRDNARSCPLTHEVMLWVVLAMGLFTDLPIRQVFKHARRLRVGEDSPHRSSLCVARQRLGVAPVRHLFTRTVRPLARPTPPGAFYRGWRLMGLDGTVLDVPDTAANAAAFGRPSAGPRGGGRSRRSASSAWSSWALTSKWPSGSSRSTVVNNRWWRAWDATSLRRCS